MAYSGPTGKVGTLLPGLVRLENHNKLSDPNFEHHEDWFLFRENASRGLRFRGIDFEAMSDLLCRPNRSHN